MTAVGKAQASLVRPVKIFRDLPLILEGSHHKTKPATGCYELIDQDWVQYRTKVAKVRKPSSVMWLWVDKPGGTLSCPTRNCGLPASRCSPSSSRRSTQGAQSRHLAALMDGSQVCWVKANDRDEGYRRSHGV